MFVLTLWDVGEYSVQFYLYSTFNTTHSHKVTLQKCINSSYISHLNWSLMSMPEAKASRKNSLRQNNIALKCAVIVLLSIANADLVLRLHQADSITFFSMHLISWLKWCEDLTRDQLSSLSSPQHSVAAVTHFRAQKIVGCAGFLSQCCQLSLLLTPPKRS